MRTGDTNSLGETIRNLRTARSMTREELAELVGISESHLNKIEAGQDNLVLLHITMLWKFWAQKL